MYTFLPCTQILSQQNDRIRVFCSPMRITQIRVFAAVLAYPLRHMSAQIHKYNEPVDRARATVMRYTLIIV